jgi:hypothetical protein
MPEAHEDEPHDILAADEFAIPGQEPGVPHDLDPRPHDVLAAEEFAFPAGAEPLAPSSKGGLPRMLGLGALGVLAVLGARRALRR